jgi:urease accessory protein
VGVVVSEDFVIRLQAPPSLTLSHNGEGNRFAYVETQQDIFAANRATGHIALTVAARDGRTRRTRVHEDGSLRVRFPNGAPEQLEATIVNTAGGMAGGDRFAIEVAVEPGADLVVGAAAAEKIYRSLGPATEVDVTLDVAAGGRLVWLPQETILFDRARLSRRIEVDLADGASLVLAEALVFGRSAMGETVEEGLLADRWRVRRGGRLLFAENTRLDGAIADKLVMPAVAAGGVAIATVLMAPADDTTTAAVRALDFAGEVGVSAWNGIAVARLCAKDGAALRHDLIAVLAALGAAVPRLWLQ